MQRLSQGATEWHTAFRQYVLIYHHALRLMQFQCCEISYMKTEIPQIVDFHVIM